MTRARAVRSNSTRVAALTMRKNGVPVKTVMNAFSPSIPKRTLMDRQAAAKEAGTFSDRPGIARPAPRRPRSDAGKRREVSVSPRMMNKIKKKINNNRHLTCNDLRTSIPGLEEVSRRTVNNIVLKDIGLSSRVAARTPLLNDRQVAGRLA